MVFYLSLSEKKSPRVSRTLLAILTDLNYAEVWKVSLLPLISNFCSLFSEPLRSVPIIIILYSLIMDGFYLSCYFQISQSLYKSFRIVPSTIITNGITVTFIFHSFLVLWQGLCTYLYFRFLKDLLYGHLVRQSPLIGMLFFHIIVSW